VGRAVLTSILLDTCAILWLAAGTRIRADTEHAVEQARSTESLPISPISAWEIAMKHARRPDDLGLRDSPESFFNAFADQAGIVLATLSVRILVRSTALQHYPHKDPADRIIIATAAEHQARIVTGDHRILDYADDSMAFR
jgi:PIN domain nuclease of toxin-antitoxin system